MGGGEPSAPFSLRRGDSFGFWPFSLRRFDPPRLSRLCPVPTSRNEADGTSRPHTPGSSDRSRGKALGRRERTGPVLQSVCGKWWGHRLPSGAEGFSRVSRATAVLLEGLSAFATPQNSGICNSSGSGYGAFWAVYCLTN